MTQDQFDELAKDIRNLLRAGREIAKNAVRESQARKAEPIISDIVEATSDCIRMGNNELVASEFRDMSAPEFASRLTDRQLSRRIG